MKKKRVFFSNMPSVFQYTFITLFCSFCFFTHADPNSENVNKNYYEILGVSENATQAEIKLATRRLRSKYHPDRVRTESEKNEYHKKMLEINKVYETLYNPNSRARYDYERKHGFQGGEASAQNRSFVVPDIHLKESRLFSVKLQPVEDPYRVLGVGRSSSDQFIRDKYEQLTNKIKKDIQKDFRRDRRNSRGLNSEKVAELNRLYSAYRILSNPEWRSQYDYSRDRTVTIEGRLFEFIDKANQEGFTIFESKNGEVFDLRENKNGERVFIRNTIFAPPEKQTSLGTVIKVAGEKLELKLVQSIEIEDPVEKQGSTEQRRVPLAEFRQQLVELEKKIEEIKQRLNDKWNRLKSTSRDRLRRSIFVQRPSFSTSRAVVEQPSSARRVGQSSPDTINLKPSDLTWEELYRMTHPYSENSTGEFKFSSALRSMPGQGANFFIGLGAFMFLKTHFDSVAYDGVQVDPQWGQTLMTQASSPLGLFSLASFILVAGQMNGLMESHINQLIKDRYNLEKAGINKGIADKGDVTDEHRKMNRDIDRRTKRIVKAIRFSRTAFALSAGMMASTAIHEFWTDPNIRGCWSGIRNKENRSQNFMEICDTAYSEWASVFKALVAVTSVALVYRHMKTKLSPFERKIAKGILGITAVIIISGFFDDWGKFGSWAPDMVTMVAAGYMATGATHSAVWAWGKTKNIREKMGQAIRDQWDARTRGSALVLQEHAGAKEKVSDRLKSKYPRIFHKLSKVGSTLGKLSRFGWPTWLVSGALSVPHLVMFFGFHELLHPVTLSLKNYFLADNIVDQQMQITSYIDNSSSQMTDDFEDQLFEFWEGSPGSDCSMSNPEEMGLPEVLEQTVFNSSREDCPGRFFSHQLNTYSNILSEWRMNQLLKFNQLSQGWKRNSTEARLWYEANSTVLFKKDSGLLSIADENGVGSSRQRWEDTHYHNIGYDDKMHRIIYQEQEGEVVCQEALAKKELCEESSSELEQSDLQTAADTLDICEEAEKATNACNKLIDEMMEKYVFYTGEENNSDESEDVNDVKTNYLMLPFSKFKWAVYQIDQYINAQSNKSKFQFNSSVLSSPFSRNYLSSNSIAPLSDEELLGSLRELFNAVDYGETNISDYYSSGEIAQCARDTNCNEDVLRARVVSAGVDLLNILQSHTVVSRTNGRRGVRPKRYSNLIESIYELFKNGEQQARTYANPFNFVEAGEGMTGVIDQHRQSKEEETGVFSLLLPMMDSLPRSPMESIVYHMVCGDDLDQFSLPDEELAKCTSEDDLEELVEQLPSFEDGGWIKPYMFKTPKLIKGQAPEGICEDEEDYKIAVHTPLTVNGRNYENLLEFVLDPNNIKQDVQTFWEEKVEKQYALLMGCFETQYQKIYTNNFLKTINSEETYNHSKFVETNLTQPVMVSMSLGSAGLGYPIKSRENISIEIPKDPIESMILQVNYLFDKLKEIHHYPEPFESVVDCESADEDGDEKLIAICNRQEAIIKYTFEQLPSFCADTTRLNQSSSMNEMQKMADISIECFREMVLDLFEHIGGRIRSQQCFTTAITDPNKENENWRGQFDYASLQISNLIPNTVNSILMSDGKSTKESCLQPGYGEWCRIHDLSFRDTATILTIRHLSFIFDELVRLHGQVSLFSSHIAVAEECDKEGYQNNSESNTLIQHSMNEFFEN